MSKLTYTTRLFLTISMAWATYTAQATDYIYYVTKNGNFNNNGLSWATAKYNVQDAINAIKGSLTTDDVAYIFVAEGTYTPTSYLDNSSELYRTFQIPAGVQVYGGFTGTETGKSAADIIAARETVETQIGTFMKHKTIFSGDLSSPAKFVWNDTKHRYSTSFFGNCYHVVWFGNNGYTTDADNVPHYNALSLGGKAKEAVLDGVTVMDGYASNSNINSVAHNAFGGGAYMVKNAVVRNCEFYHCEATRDGGAIYMDGGGLVENCYVHDCQALGVNTTTGYGGGICANQEGIITRSAIINNVGRSGGGIALVHDNARPGSKYALATSATLIAQNVSTAEAGGVYLYQGGLLNGVTIVNNFNYGSGVTMNGIVTGRAGGIYVRDHARIYNSVLWGNGTTATNTNNVQYACTRSSSDIALKPELYYVALSRADYTDWSGSKKVSLKKLSDSNAGTSTSLEKYPMFDRPYATAGHITDQSDDAFGSGSYVSNTLWQPTASSGICYAGLQLADLNVSDMQDLSAGVLTVDIRDNAYSPKCALGAYAAQTEHLAAGLKVLYVDPNRMSGVDYSATLGQSWDTPLDNLTDALNYFHTQGTAGTIYVKQGTLETASRVAEGHVRTTTIPMVSNVAVLGGYSSSLKGTDLSKRNPVEYPTVVSGEVSVDDYTTNVAHLVTFNGIKNATLDGVQLRWGNASSSIQSEGVTPYGGGIFLNESSNISIKNVLVANCAGTKGAAVYASGTNASPVSVNFENCIFHNNQACSKYLEAGSVNYLAGGIIYAGPFANITMNHCDVLRNVGYGFVVEDNSGVQSISNSIFFANMDDAYSDTKLNPANALAAMFGYCSVITGTSNVFDKATVLTATTDEVFTANSIPATIGKVCLGLNEDDLYTYARFVNPTKNSGISTGGDVTYYGRATSFIPTDINPAVNAASTGGIAHRTALSDDSWGYDMTLAAARDFGGLPDCGAMENGFVPASSATQPSYGTTYYVRDYRYADGSVDYTSGGNGLSWATAINGNAWYNEAIGQNMGMAPVDYTYRISDPHFYSKTGWTEVSNANGTPSANVKYNSLLAAVEFYNVTFDYYQILNNMPNGWYYLSCQGFYRNGTVENNRINQYGHAVLYANDTKVSLMNISAEAAENERLDIRSIQNGFTAENWPDQYFAASYCFNYGLYNNGLWVKVTDGTIRLGVKKFTAVTNDWAPFTNFQLKYYGNTDNHPEVIGVNGLQMAVNNANAAMSSAFVVQKIENGFEKEGNDSDGGTGTNTTRTFYKFEPTEEHPQVDVWVGAGVYTNHDGWKIRNHVRTYGGFPKTGNPGMNERHPQLTNGIPLSSGNSGLNVADYETILQTNSSVEERNEFRKSVGVLEHPFECRVTVYDDYNKHHTRVVYEDVEWDGFTFRYGCKEGIVAYNGRHGRRNGGAGVSIYENVTIRNCVIRDNYTGDGILTNGRRRFRQSIGRGGGFYCDGGVIENCYIMDNISDCTGNGNENYGGGLYMIRGTMYNTVVAGNRINYEDDRSMGNGVFFESAKFYNNTIVNNFGGTSAIAVWTASAADASLTVYNSIVMDKSKSILRLEGSATPVRFDHCFLQTQNSKKHYGSYSDVKYTECVERIGVSGTDANPFALPFEQAVQNYDYRINFHDDGTNCVNAGTENLGKETYYNKRDTEGVPQAIFTDNVYLPANDMDWTDRIQDCRVDIGAYEYNGAAEITPDTDVKRTGDANTVVYYVTEKGFGSTQAFDPANAACAQKLQKVLDAAGRYKYNHPDKKVIVKLAGVDATAPGYKESDCFKYYPCRSTDATNDNVRVWSIMVPRGIEVWGGYSVEDVLSETTNDAIFPSFTDDERSVMYHPTYLQPEYENTALNETVKGYHVVTFTDRLYDIDGLPFLAGDAIINTGRSSYTEQVEESQFAHLSDKAIADRAVLDGLFLVGGQADGESFGNNSNVNANQYGGAAIVTDYAHVRNCIVKGNTATFGGALALQNKALVSGTLIMENQANYGGGIYVVEDNVTMNNVTNSTSQNGSGALDANMPHIYTTTIVQNTGSSQGGGLWFSNDAEQPNVRVNSSVLWQNDSPDQANVAGQTSPELPLSISTTMSTIDWYPFAYSAVENLRMSGVSNISVDMQNRKGNRFAIDSKTDPTLYDEQKIAIDTAQINFYGLTVFSALCRTGMPYSDYQKLVETQGLTEQDYNKWRRDIIPEGTDARTYIDIGARAFPSSPVTDTTNIFLRLFVAQTNDVDMDAYLKMQDWCSDATKESPNYIYGKLGSSFAYPFQNLDDALEYIYTIRKTSTWKDKANNLRFEICMSRGEYYPQRDMQGNYGYSLANTFLIPEGVTLMGGFDCTNLYGQYWMPKSYPTEAGFATSGDFGNDLDANQKYFGGGSSVVRENKVGVEGATVTLIQMPLEELAANRELEDINFNSILEPWEFQNQTTLSGNTVNLQNSGVYHVVSVVPYAPAVGQLPAPTWVNEEYEAHGQAWGYGSESKEKGQPVIIDGVHISDGYACDYISGSINDMGIFDYYRGGGLHATGNWYCSDIMGSDNDFKHKDIANAVAYRDMPIYIKNTSFINNQAGYGAAMDVNVSTYIYGSIFAQNMASYHKDVIYNYTSPLDETVHRDQIVCEYAGNGGAIYSNKHLEVYNTIFSNNEAKDATGNLESAVYQALSTPVNASEEYSGLGGAIVSGSFSRMKVMNCDFVNNKATAYPALFTMNPTVIDPAGDDASLTEADYNLVINNVFWGNVANSKVRGNDFARNLAINYCNPATWVADGRKYDIHLDKAPQSQNQLDANFNEAIWFSAYEEGCGKTVRNDQDFRTMPYATDQYIGASLRNYWNSFYADKGDYEEQNANIQISSENNNLEGPNFSNPSTTAGCAGYNEQADWSRARINNLTDNGSCLLAQNSTADVSGEETVYITNWEQDGEIYEGSGAYYVSHYQTPANQKGMKIGSDIYMTSYVTGENLPRVAHDADPTATEAYIDLGVYEYPRAKLHASVVGDQVDILWVTTSESWEYGTPDGSTWQLATSDLQLALETLLSSRNGHRKELRLLEGEYTPIKTAPNGYKAFYFNTEALNNSVIMPKSFNDGSGTKNGVDDYCVTSISIKGGYSSDLEGQYDPEQYPAVIRQTASNGAKSNYLIYVDDMLQRYGDGTGAGDGVLANNGNVNAANENKSVSTIPMQIDGVTFINNQAASGTQGCDVYYKEQTYTYTVNEGKDNEQTYTYAATAPKEAAITISEKLYEELQKEGTSTVFTRRYKDEARTIQTTDNDPEGIYISHFLVKQNPAKIVLSKDCFMNSGSANRDNTSSAVFIGQYGGEGLIYNTVFHSNYGNPLEAYNTRTINNTIALNKGKWTLVNMGEDAELLEESGSGSGVGPMLAPMRMTGSSNSVIVDPNYQPRKSNIMNSILWRNNPSVFGYGNQFSLSGYKTDASSIYTYPAWGAQRTDTIFMRNAYTLYLNGEMQKTIGTNYEEGTAIAEQLWNTHIVDDNNDISYGPHFAAPNVEATTDEAIEARDFSLYPSVRIINKGANHIYGTEVYDLAWIPTTELDFIGQSRVISGTIEKGAIEYPQPLVRVVYVDPNQSNSTGTSWETPMGGENLQNAIDLVAIYCATKNIEYDSQDNHIVDRNEAYVFVKGNNNQLLDGITLRKGVNIYGSISSSYADTVRFTIGESGEYLYPHLSEDVAHIAADRPGLVCPSSDRTYLSAISTGDDEYETDRPTLVNGFVISGKNPATGEVAPSETPVLNIIPSAVVENDVTYMPALCVSNIVVADNELSNGRANMAEIDNALIYEVLFRNNKVGDNQYVLNLRSNAFGVNLTVEGLTNDAAGKVPMGAACLEDNRDNGHIWYSIYNYGGFDHDEKTLSGFNYTIDDQPNLNYQLAENSRNIDYCPVVNPMLTYVETNPSTKNLVQFINYVTDLDLLGNPRVLNVTNQTVPVKKNSRQRNYVLDRGAFETWCIGNEEGAMNVKTDILETNYGGNYYPHEGSVVYIMENSNFVTQAHEMRPGYLLVKKGGSLYGHGQTIKAWYVGVERDVHTEGQIMALPYDMIYLSDSKQYGPANFSYADETGVLTLQPDAEATTSIYNGKARAKARYQIMDKNSACWETISATDIVEACQGVFFAPSQSSTYRFTGKGTGWGSNIYNEEFEDEATFKSVVLKQNNLQPTDGKGLLTAAEDMGWNCFGLPYLVSEYKPYVRPSEDGLNNASSTEYKMQLPKELWLWYDGVGGTVLPDGTRRSTHWDNVIDYNYAGFYAVKSWENSAAAWHLAADQIPSIWVSEGMFAQTASYTDEELRFYLPVYVGNFSAEAPERRLSRIYVGEAIEDQYVAPDTEGYLFDMQGRRIQTPSGHGVYVKNGKKVWM